MPQRHKTLDIVIVVVTGLSLLSGCFGIPGASRSTANKPEEIESPQHDRTLVVDINTSQDDPTKYLTLIFEVRDKASQTVLHRQQTRGSSRMAWSMRWLDNGTVQLSSSDVGTYCWQEQTDGVWTETSCP